MESKPSLLQLAEKVNTLAEKHLELQFAFRDAQEALRQAEVTALLGTEIDGKNETIRSAQLWELTRMERLEAEMAERAMLRAKVELHGVTLLHQTEFAIINAGGS